MSILRKSFSQELTLKIGGMHCGMCAKNIENGLTDLPGILKVQVSFDTKKAAVKYDSAKITPEKIIAAVGQIGYTAEKAE